MIANLQIYKCQHCGSIVEVVHAGGGELVCCGEPMALITENSVDASKEKHVPVIEKTDGGYMVTVGSVPHPMEEKHYIEWIELIADGKAYRQFLNPGERPEAFFGIVGQEGTAVGQKVTLANARVREYCNLHGLWKNEA